MFSVERLESSYKNSSLVANILVYACQDYNEVVALIFPNKVNLERWAASQGIVSHNAKPNRNSFLIRINNSTICADDPKANKAVLDSLMQTWKANQSQEHGKNFRCCPYR
jgi:long-subunit acyl-CoA synthetase (AMP-forming)